MPSVVEETLEQKLKRHEDALVACMAEITKLRQENARLRSESDGAHDVLRRIYLDEATPSSVRVKAAQAALNVEKPRLAPIHSRPLPRHACCEILDRLGSQFQGCLHWMVSEKPLHYQCRAYWPNRAVSILKLRPPAPQNSASLLFAIPPRKNATIF